MSVIDLLTHDVVAADPTASAADAQNVGGHSHVAAAIGGRLYVANATTDSLTVVEGAASTVADLHPVTSAVDAIPLGAAPVDIVVSGERLYISNLSSGTVVVLDTGINEVVETVKAGIKRGLVTASPDGRTIYVADVMGGTVRVITSVHEVADGSVALTPPDALDNSHLAGDPLAW